MRQKGVGACFSLSLLQMLWSFQSLPSDAALACFEGHSVIRKEVGMKVFSFFSLCTVRCWQCTLSAWLSQMRSHLHLCNQSQQISHAAQLNDFCYAIFFTLTVSTTTSGISGC